MAPPRTKTALWSQYLGVRAVEMFACTRPLQANMRLAQVVGRLLHRFDRRHRDRALQNINRAFPSLSAMEQDKVAAEACEHFLKLVVELVHSPRMLHHDSWGALAQIRTEELAPACELLNSGKPMILLTGHFGNWEIMGTMLALMGYSLDAIARPLDNRLIDNWMTRVREKRGLRVMTKWDATDRMLEVLHGGGALGFIADQNAGDRGLFVPFFGKLASTYKSIGLLAMNCNVPIVCGYARRRNDQMGYELGTTDIIYPQDWQAASDPLYYITARYMRAIEEMVRRWPTQYLWMHRRWKSRPRHERQGKPMPASLQRSLESLPWMDQQTLDSVATGLEPAA